MSFGAGRRGKPFGGWGDKLRVDYRIGGNPRYYIGEEWLMLVPDDIRKCVAFAAYKLGNEYVVAGTVFFVGYSHYEADSFTFAVTARHVIDDIREISADGKLYLRLNFIDGSARYVGTELSKWRLHPTDSSVDVAVFPVPILEKYDHLAYPTSAFATDAVIKQEDIGIGEDLFLAGLFFGHFGEKRNIPILRVGNIAAMPEESIDTEMGRMDAFLVETRSIGGLSGSPVFVNLGFVRPDSHGKMRFWEGESTRTSMFYLLGLMHGHYRKGQEKDLARFDDREPINMGIAIVVPANKILEVIEQPSILDEMRSIIEARRKQNLPIPD